MSIAAVSGDVFDPPRQQAGAGRAATPSPRVPAGSGVGQWKRQVQFFAVLMITLVVGLSAGSAALMWRLLHEVSASERDNEAKAQAATRTRQEIIEIDRLLMKSIALSEPDQVRAAAVASIGAAAHLEDSITELRKLLPDSADAAEMAALVDGVKVPRMKVATLARKGLDAEALDMLASIGEPMQRIDALSNAIQQTQGMDRLRSGVARQALFSKMLAGLLVASAGGVALGLLFYWRLMKRLSRSDEIERLLGEVNHSAETLEGDGQQLARLNTGVRQANEQLTAVLGRFRDTFAAMEGDTGRALGELKSLAEVCGSSMATSRQQAGDAGVVAQQVRAALVTMHELQEGTQALSRSRGKIAGFTESIARISSTTRLLSMNAAVEAARAGEAGRGFNVVAQSIRRLSDDTQAAAIEIRRASEDISQQLGSTEQSVKRTGQLMDDCAQRIAALEASAAHNRELVEAMAADLQGFRTSFERQAGRVRDMESDVGSLDGTLHEGHAHAQLLDGTARALADTSSRMLKRLASVLH